MAWFLVISSIGFSIPTVLAHRRKKRKMSKACGLLTVTSIVNHSTAIKWVTCIDKCIAHCFAGAYSLNSIANMVLKRRWRDFGHTSCAISCIVIYETKSRWCDHWHLLLHLISQVGLTVHALE